MPYERDMYIQGKADAYTVPKDQEGRDEDSNLMEAYMRTYNQIRLHPHEQRIIRETRDEIQRLKAKVNALATQNQ